MLEILLFSISNLMLIIWISCNNFNEMNWLIKEK